MCCGLGPMFFVQLSPSTTPPPLQQHKQETEDWLEARKKENDATRAELAKERAQLESEQKHLQAETEKLIMDRAKLDEEEVAFKEKQTKLDTILSQMKGLG